MDLKDYFKDVRWYGDDDDDDDDEIYDNYHPIYCDDSNDDDEY